MEREKATRVIELIGREQKLQMMNNALRNKATDLWHMACGLSDAEESKALRAEAERYEALATVFE